ncbi:MAG: site-2 protease family protein [Ardenticatenales bacterium]|nr:site-2 protease family protein [Ardenticatenales bacterium]
MWAWRIGSVQGIDIKIHLTFPLVILWAATQFGSSPQYVLFGTLLVLLLFGCVLLHELGHALVARYYNLPVEDITLLPIGGVARFRVLRDSPKEELAIALAGPLVNVAISVLLFPLLIWGLDLLNREMLSEVSARTGRSEFQVAFALMGSALRRLSFEGALVYLFFANLMLALFNMIPAMPMDGGRVLRAVLAMALPYKFATTIAVRLGQFIALLMAFWGLQGGNFGLLLVAFFVFVSGGAEIQRVALREVLLRGQVRSYMMEGLPINPYWSLYAVRLLAQQSGQRAFPVLLNGTLLGLLTVRELHQHPASETVQDAMVEDFSIVPPEHTLYDAQVTLQGENHFAAAVMEDGRLLGLLSLEDIDRAYHSLRRQPQIQWA